MSENPYDLICLIAVAAMATVLAFAGLAIAADAIRSWHRAWGAVFSSVVVAASLAAAFTAVALLMLHWAAPSTG